MLRRCAQHMASDVFSNAACAEIDAWARRSCVHVSRPRPRSAPLPTLLWSDEMTATLDPVTLEVIRNALPAVANEMAVDLQRTSYNMMIYEVRDFCTALVNTAGELICQNVGGVSHFVADLGVIIIDAMTRYGKDGFAPGDVVIT